MGCNKSKSRTEGTEIGHEKPRNKDQGVQQRQSHRVVKVSTKKNEKDQLKTAMKVKVAETKVEKHVRFEEPITSEERIFGVEEEVAESEDESFHSAEGEVDTNKEKKRAHSIPSYTTSN